MEREYQNTAQIVAKTVVFVLAEISAKLEAELVLLGQKIEEEAPDTIHERFVVQEHLGEVAQVLGVGRILESVDFPNRDFAPILQLILVYHVAGRVDQVAAIAMGLQQLRCGEEAEAELAEMDLSGFVVAVGEGRIIPRI